MKLNEIKNKMDLCQLLDISEKELNYILYICKNKYETFLIPKKNDEARKISAPNKQLKYVQYKLLKELEQFYNVPKAVHGFVYNKSVASNAKLHLKKNYILNIDIKDFFPSITFKRINGLLMKSPFGLDYKLSIMISNLLTDNGVLPQGAPSSPIVTNVICKRLDNQLIKFAKNFNLVYTRYADDMTFSWNESYPTNKIILNRFPIKLCDELINIFLKNGFIINEEKTRLQDRFHHQEVTGVTVNEKNNVSNFYFYRVRSMLHSWEEFGLELAYKDYCSRNNLAFNPKNKQKYDEVVLGLISYLGMVKGIDDKRYCNLALRYNKLKNKNIIKPIFDSEDISNSNVFIITTLQDQNKNFCGGTTFRINNYFITCTHCLFNPEDKIDLGTFFTIFQNGKKTYVELKYVSKKYDYAILKDNKAYGEVFLSKYSEICNVTDDIRVFGYPDVDQSCKCSLITGKMIGYLSKDNIDYYTTDGPIISGNSGGPVLNNKNELIGICVYGNGDIIKAKGKNGILPIKHILDDYKNETGNDLI